MFCFTSSLLDESQPLMICSFSSFRCVSYNVASCMSCSDIDVGMSVVGLMGSKFNFIPLCLSLSYSYFVFTASQLCIYQGLVWMVCRFFCNDGFWVICVTVSVMGLLQLFWVSWLMVCDQWLFSLLLQSSSFGMSLAHVVF